MKSQLNAEIDERLLNNKFDMTDILVDAPHYELVEAIKHCLCNHSYDIERIVLQSLPAIRRLRLSDWKQAITTTESLVPVNLRKFMDFLLIYCRLDGDYLTAMGIPCELIDEYMANRAAPGFPYFHPSENAPMDATQMKFNKMKLDSIAKYGLSDAEVLEVFNMFTTK